MSSMHPVKAWRLSLGESLRAVAKRVGTSKATLSRIENGKQAASLALISRMKAESNGVLSADDFLHSIETEAAE